jgi:hypothetical protein
MPFVSITRLRIRSPRFLPLFGLHTFRSIRQVRKAPGCKGGSLLADRSWTFWTMTAWDSQDSMRRYMTKDFASRGDAASSRLVRRGIRRALGPSRNRSASLE